MDEQKRLQMATALNEDCAEVRKLIFDLLTKEIPPETRTWSGKKVWDAAEEKAEMLANLFYQSAKKYREVMNANS